MIQERSILKVVPILSAQSAAKESRIHDFSDIKLKNEKSGRINVYK